MILHSSPRSNPLHQRPLPLPGLLLAAAFLALLPGCATVVNHAAFYPDRTFALPVYQLPADVHHEFIFTADSEKIELIIVSVRDSRTRSTA